MHPAGGPSPGRTPPGPFPPGPAWGAPALVASCAGTGFSRLRAAGRAWGCGAQRAARGTCSLSDAVERVAVSISRLCGARAEPSAPPASSARAHLPQPSPAARPRTGGGGRSGGRAPRVAGTAPASTPSGSPAPRRRGAPLPTTCSPSGTESQRLGRWTIAAKARPALSAGGFPCAASAPHPGCGAHRGGRGVFPAGITPGGWGQVSRGCKEPPCWEVGKM